MSNFIRVANFPSSFGCFIPKPVIKGDNEIIFTSNAISMYNPTSNEITELNKFDKEFQLNFHSQFIDPKNDNLYLVNGDEEEGIVMYNFNTKKMQKISSDLQKIGSYPSRCIYHEKTDQMVCSVEGYHVYTLNKDKLDTYLLDYDYGMYTFGIPLVIRDEIKIFGGSDDYIVTSVNASKVTDLNACKWKTYDELKMPHIVSRFNYFDAVAFGDIAIIFYFGYNENETEFLNEIWCIDFISKLSFKSAQTLPFKDPKTKEKIMWYSFKLNNDNHIHIIDFITSQHYKINLYTLIPTKLSKKHCNYYNPLVFGFCRNNAKKLPISLINLVFNYFPYLL